MREAVRRFRDWRRKYLAHMKKGLGQGMATRGRILAAIAAFAALAGLATCHMSGVEEQSGAAVAPSIEERVEEAAEELTETITQPRSPQESWLDDRFYAIGSTFDGFLGIAMVDVDRGAVVHFNGHETFPQQSVSKLWVALTAFDQADKGTLDLTESGTVRTADLTVFHQPLRKRVIAQGSFTTTYADYIRRALTESDNTANDMVLKRIGGPDAVRAMLAEKELADIRFGPGERAMQAAIAGLEWDQSYSIGKTFFEVRKTVPHDLRRTIFDNYVGDPVDGARPVGAARALARLAKGELLSEGSTARLLTLLDDVKSGPNRLKGGLPAGWGIGHKTGTGQVLDIVPPGAIGEQAGYNDIGILTAPDGSRYAVAVMIGRTARPVPERMELMHEVVAAIAEYHALVSGAAATESDPSAEL